MLKHLLFGLAMVAPALALAGEEKPTQGELTTRDGDQLVDVPLKHTDVRITVNGVLADVTVTQTFVNPYKDKIEATYLFPLPTQAAVDAMKITTNGRTIEGQIQKKEEAKKTYEAAVKAGHVAALLTEERPNLFSQELGNLDPGAEVVVTLDYVEAVPYEAGSYELVYPLVATPRPVPASSKLRPEDAALVQPVNLPAGLRPASDVSIAAALDAGVPIQKIESPSHQLVVDGPNVRVAAGDAIPNKDFVLRWTVAGDAPAFALLPYRDPTRDAEGSFYLIAQPPTAPAADAIAPRELIFVLDTSSSMRGAPLVEAKQVVRRALDGMGADDTFSIVRFDDQASALGPRPIANKKQNVDLALQWLDGLAAGGTTDLSTGIKAALDLPHDPARLRVVAFLTDGYVGDEDDVLKLVGDDLGASRLFAFGVGSAPNRYLLEGLAEEGRGGADFVRLDEDPAAAVERFYRRIDRPVLTDLAIDWKGLAVADVTPGALPDLFAGQPLVVAGHYARGGAATIAISAVAGGRRVTFDVPVTLPDVDASRPDVATVWAKARIGELERQQLRKDDPARKDEILRLALADHLMTPYTAFVAVDTSSTTSPATAKKVVVPVEVPDGVAVGMESGSYGSGGGSSTISGEGYGAGLAQPTVVYAPTHQQAYYEYDIGKDGGGGGAIGDDREAVGASPQPHAMPAPPAPTVAAPTVAPLPDSARADTKTPASVEKEHDAVDRVATAAQLADVAKCFADPAVAPHALDFLIYVDASGHVTSVEVGQIASGPLHDCLAAKARAWTFTGGARSIHIPVGGVQ